MTRIEPQQDTRPTGKSSGLMKTIGKFFLFFIRLPFRVTFRLILIAVILFVLLQIIRTGAWTVPVASDIFYRQPEPAHEVRSAVFSKELLLLRMEESINASSDAGVPSYVISEEELTALLEQVLLEKDNQPFLTGQIAILDGELEFFGNLRSNHNVFITALLEPQKDGETNVFKVNSLKIGNVQIPTSVVSSGIMTFLGSSLLQLSLPKVTFDSMLLIDGKMTLIGIGL